MQPMQKKPDPAHSLHTPRSARQTAASRVGRIQHQLTRTRARSRHGASRAGTTRATLQGIWLSTAPKLPEPLTLVMDLEVGGAGVWLGCSGRGLGWAVCSTACAAISCVICRQPHQCPPLPGWCAQGSDGRERGEDDTNFERQAALFALAVADILLVGVPLCAPVCVCMRWRPALVRACLFSA